MATYAGKFNYGSQDLPIGATLYGTCDTAAATAAKVATLSNFDYLMTGVTVHIKFTNSNTADNPTLKVGSTDAKSIKRYGTTAPGTEAETSWNAGSIVSFTYDGTYWIMDGWLNSEGGASDYSDLTNKPQINSVTLTGNKSLSDIGAASQSDLEDLEDITGDGQLSGFTATDLTGASNELKNTLNQFVRPNLLDNWYFGKPVNQRGQSSYSNTDSYTIDRWKLTSGSVEVVSGGITLNGTLVQILEASIGQTVTASALLSDGTMITPTYNDTTKTFTLTATGQTIKAVKLELGSGQTLAHNEGTEANPVWVLNEIPNYGEQKMRCQRYLQILFKNVRMRSTMRTTSQGNTVLDFPWVLIVEMANAPTITNGTWSLAEYGSASSSDVASEYTFSTPNTKRALLNIRATKANSTSGLVDGQLYSTTNVFITCEP